MTPPRRSRSVGIIVCSSRLKWRMNNSRPADNAPVNPLLVEINLEHIRFEPGYWNGLRQPAFIIDVCFPTDKIQLNILEQYDRIVAALLPAYNFHLDRKIADQHRLLTRLADTSVSILAEAGMPVMAGATAAPIRRENGTHWLLGLPAVSADFAAPRRAIIWTAKLMNSVAADGMLAIDSLRDDFQKLIEISKKLAPSGVNSLRFLQAAHDEDIPWRHVANNTYQFGWGSKARWLDSSFTDETSRIGATLARDKSACAKVLREAGLPVPAHWPVSSCEQALAAAEALGYPVVIKPADLDGGQGVLTGLTHAKAVEKAYATVSKISKHILVEQQIEGNDYRLQVYKDEVFSVIHRRPAYVRGDGVTTVEELINKTNYARQQPRSGSSGEQGRKPIIIDEELRDWLTNQGLTLNSVPVQGQHVRLRGPANVNIGGTREDIFDEIHPDNVALAVRAASVMRLDLAGVDLLIPDISRSWIETGAAICEVNAQPQISRHLQRLILPRMVSNKGRIPIIAIVGSIDGGWRIRERLLSEMLPHNIRLAWVKPGYASINQETLHMPDRNVFAACRALLADPRVDALVWQIPAWPPRSLGLPFDHIDAAVIFNNANQSAKAVGMNAAEAGQLTDITPRLWTADIAALDQAGPEAIAGFAARMAELIVSIFRGAPAKELVGN